MQKKIKILMSLNSLGIGGNEIFAINVFRHVNKEKFQVCFQIYDENKLDLYEEIISNGGKVFVIEDKSYKYRKHELKCLLESEKIDILHINSCSLKGLLRTALPVAKTVGRKTKIIAHAHNMGTPKNTVIDKTGRHILKSLLSSIVDYGFACSQEAGASKFTKSFLGGDRFCIINNAIEQDRFKYDKTVRDRLRKEMGIEDKFVIGSVGRLEEQKNYSFFLDVLKSYTGWDANAVFLIVGDGSQRKELEQKVSDLQLNTHVIFVGKVSDSENYYQAMDLFVLPSIYEGFPFVSVEAQVSGLPCIVSDRITREIDISGRVSFIPLNIDTWIDAIQNENHVKNNRKSCFNTKYELTSEIMKIEGIYEKLIE